MGRARIAAEDGAASLTRILRSAELAGHDPRAVLVEAVTDRSLDGARSATNVIYSRITDRHRFDPTGNTWAEWTPRIEDPGWQAYLDRLAGAADARAAQLGRDAAEHPPAWAVAAFGRAPVEPSAREEWVADVGVVAAYRELSGHTGDTDALGPAPGPGQVEAFAAYRSAWRALGRPEVDLAEREFSDGQLRMRVRAAARETTWGPRYVGNELAATHQAADAQRHKASILAAEAEQRPADEQPALLQQARDAHALADTLAGRAQQLQELDDARSRWLAHTAGTRAAGERAQAELALRHADDLDPEPRVTADEWLTADRTAVAEDDLTREVTADHELDQATDTAERDEYRDIREVTDREPRQHGEDALRVPTARETAAALDRAQRALAEIASRDAYDERHNTEDRATQLTVWHTDDSHLDDLGEDRTIDEGRELWQHT